MAETQQANPVFLSLGSNQGDRMSYLENAIIKLTYILTELKVSGIYETKPLYLENQPQFLNCVVYGNYNGGPFELLKTMQHLEISCGRTQSVQKGPRTLDIDILLFADLIIKTENLIIPHPGMKERAFVIVPLVKLASQTKDPASGELYADYLPKLANQDIYIYRSDDYN